MLNEMLVQEIQDLKAGGYALGEAVQHLRRQYGKKAPSIPTVRKYYADLNVSSKVAKIIQSYTGVVDKMVWRKQ